MEKIKKNKGLGTWKQFPTNYHEAATIYKTSPKPVVLAPKTELVQRFRFSSGHTPVLAIKLHETDIVSFVPSGWVIVNSGGHRSNLTLDRMRRAGIEVRTQAGTQMVRLSDGTWTRYRDGMRIRGTQVLGGYKTA